MAAACRLNRRKTGKLRPVRLRLTVPLEGLIEGIEGASDVSLEQATGLPMLQIEPRREALARYGLSVTDVQSVVRTALAGTPAGQVFEGDRRFDIIVRLPESERTDIDRLGRLNIPLPGSRTGPDGFIPLAEVADITLTIGPN